MPTKRLSVALVNRLRRLIQREEEKTGGSGRIYGLLGQMRNVDHRRNERPHLHTSMTHLWGRRVRQMNVSRNFPKTKLVLKRVHDGSAEKIIQELKDCVREHNKKFSATEEAYTLVEPKAYVIGEYLVAMSKTDAPSIDEILSEPDWSEETRRGQDFFKKINKAHNVTKEDLRAAFKRVLSRTGISNQNLLLLGFEEGKFVFMPLVDIR